jgi:hypothetical protein
MRVKRPIFAVLLVGLLAAAPVLAHHSVGSVYERNSVTVKGTVTGYEWSSPHSIISVAVKDGGGKVEEWHAEILPPPEMTRAGWTKESIRLGDEVSLTGRPGKYAQHVMWLEYLVTADGRKLGRKP